MDKLFVQTSKLGDLCSILPIAHLATKFGKRVGIMTCPEYAPLLDGCSYVDKVVFDGKPREIEKAVEQAKKLCPAVHVTQINGPTAVVKKLAYEAAGQKECVTDSFDREPWKLLGLLDEWGKHPLVFDQRAPEREAKLLPEKWLRTPKGKRHPIILVAAESVSSPFPYRDLLLDCVLQSRRMDKYTVINLADIKGERFYDLLGLYEIAHCLITVDTAHLHLARAVPSLPVMALVQDSPTYWHGTAWRPSHHFHCRYSDFPKRALELYTAIDNIDGFKPNAFGVHAYPGEVRKPAYLPLFAIQPGSIGRDSSLVLKDNEHWPMLRDALGMALAQPHDWLCLSRRENKVPQNLPTTPGYAYRLFKGKEFVPTADLFCAPADFWRKILPELPDLVMSPDAYWSRVVLELFKAHGAQEIEPVIYDV